MSVRTSIIVVLLSFGLGSLAAAPQAELWPRWEVYDPESTIAVDHALWQSFLDRYLIASHSSGINRLDYDRVDREGRALLERYIEAIASQSPAQLSRSEQLPYWINLYNALTVRLILDNLPIETIRDIDDPWDTSLVSIEGVSLTLNDIEHRIIRPIWRDNRIHFLVNCASIGCPNLQAEALTADTYDRIADYAVREYLAHPRGIEMDGNRLVLSSLFNWYAEDFGSDRAALIDYLAAYAPPETAATLRNFSGRIRYRYDWSLNAPTRD